MFSPAPNKRQQSRLVSGICLVLALGTFLLYWPVAHHPFVTLDDNLYVTENPQVQAGLTGAGFQWAFTNTSASNWHPLTWISHMLDCQWFGLNPAGHHLTNVFFHIANTLLLFFWLKGLTGAMWRSAVVAALFAWHPLHVESVAWVAERKDVLSSFFWLLTLLTYTSYARSVTRARPAMGNEPAVTRTVFRPSFFFYGLTLFWLACGLMSKPMVVTLPFVLLLVDFWPLGRIGNPELGTRNFKRVLLEKLPFIVLVIADCALSLYAQKGGGATWSSEALPFPVRLANALVSYVRYVSKTFWPSDLAVIYPYEQHWPLLLVLAAAAFLLICSILTVLRRRQIPYLFFGWFYFLGTLVPAIGLVQVGAQGMADRYIYLPSIGLFIIAAWGANDLVANRLRSQKLAWLTAVAACCACCLITARQLKYWASSLDLFAHTVAVTSDNYAATAYLGGALDLAGRKDEAMKFYAESVRITPYFPFAQWNLGMALLSRGRAAEAGEHLAMAAKLTPRDPVIRLYYGQALFLAGNPSLAQEQLTEVLQLKPDYAEAQLLLAICLTTQNQTAKALPHFAEAVRLAPDNAEMRFNYGLALLDNHQPAEAATQFSEELRRTPDETKAHYRLAQALQQQGKLAEAVSHFQTALKLTPEFPEARNALAAILSAHPELK